MASLSFYVHLHILTSFFPPFLNDPKENTYTMIKAFGRLLLCYLGLCSHIAKQNFIHLSWSRPYKRSPLPKRGQSSMPFPLLHPNNIYSSLRSLPVSGSLPYFVGWAECLFDLLFKYHILLMKSQHTCSICSISSSILYCKPQGAEYYICLVHFYISNS